MTTTKRLAVGTSALGAAGCAACCAAPVAAVAATTVLAPVVGVAALTTVAITLHQRRNGPPDSSDERTSMQTATTARAPGLRAALAALLVASAALFAFGVAREHAIHHEEPKASAPAAESRTESGSESGAGTESHASTPTEATHSESTAEASVLGVDLESWPLVLAFGAVCVGLAIAVVRSRARVVLLATAVVVGVAAVFDVAEIVHQANESQTELVIIAAGVLILHLVALGLAVGIAVMRKQEPLAPRTTVVARG